MAASEAMPDIFRLLFKYPENKADVNSTTKEGLHALHILLAQLIDLANLENKPPENRGADPPTDEDIEQSLFNVIECISMLIAQKGLKVSFDAAPKIAAEKNAFVTSRVTMRKLITQTPLQIVCSFQTWNAKPITETLHEKVI